MNQLTPQDIRLKDWITVGAKDAIVCRIYENKTNTVEIVYLDRDRAINEDVHFVNGQWTFVNDGPCGGYADNSPGFAEFISKLRAGRYI